jgi:hypothetical protein
MRRGSQSHDPRAYFAVPQPYARPAAVLRDELDALAKIALELAGS